MKNLLSLRATAAHLLLLLVALCGLPPSIAAQTTISLHDDFDYPLGNLYQQGDWVRNGGNEADPIQVIGKSLTYAGYYDNADGKCVKLNNTKSGEDLQKRFTTDDDGVKTGNIYYSALVNIEEAPSKDSYIMALVLRTKASVVDDGKNGIDLGRLYIGKGDADDEVKVGIERGGTKVVYATTPLKLNQTYLIVMRYEINEAYPGEGLDNVYLYVNPASAKTEPETPTAVLDGAKFSSNGVKNYGLQGIVLRQGTTATVTAPVAYIGSVRVAATYAGLFGEAAEEKTPTINVNIKDLELGTVYTGDTFSGEIMVAGSNLSGDVSVSSSSTDVVISPATLSKAEVESGDAAKFSIKLKYTEGNHAEKITLKSEGAKDVEINVTWNGYTVPEVATLKELREKDPELGQVYLYTGEAVVTYVDKGGSYPVYYLQDATAAMPVGDDYGTLTSDNKAGDKVTAVAVMTQSSFGTVSGIVCNSHIGALVSENNTVEPKSVSLADFNAAPASYAAQLITVDDVTFKDVAEGATFKEGMTQPIITDGTNEANVRIFKGTSLIGSEIPTTKVSVTGISTSEAKAIIAPRSVEDITAKEPAGDPEFTLDKKTFEMVAGVVGKSVEAATFHISSKNIPGGLVLGLAGANSSQFELSTTSIAKGSQETDVTVTYSPTEEAKHRATITISCPSMPELAETVALSAYAIDKNNPPTATVEPQTIEGFSAKVGETDEKTIEITTANMPDYAYLKVREAGSFILSNTMLLRNTKNTVKVTFKPNAAGTYDNALVVSALGMETDIEIPITGVATDTPQEPTTEGDEFKLSTESPRTLLIETFDNQERNKPLKIDGWTNTAIEGTRAWWGYSFLDTDASAGEKVAKVTAYDSRLEDGQETPAQMMLITPPLDFKNAASKMFTFRVRGDYLMDNQPDLLELCYIDMEDGTPYVAPVEGFSMPATKDESGEWFSYQIDLSDYELADVFFMGFRFTSTRGHYNSATYYIDDVSYGRTDLPVIHAFQSVAFAVSPGSEPASRPVNVTAENLTEPISISLGGVSKNKFSLSATELPANGGSFYVSFDPSEEGVFEAYIRLQSKGAADKYIQLTANCSTASGISEVPATAGRVAVYTLGGSLITEKQNATPAEAVEGVAPGTYIIRTATDNAIGTYKVQVK